MIIIDCEQGTPEWHEARLGKVTASRIADLMAKTKSGWGASRKNYMAELIAQKLTGVIPESYTNAAMQWGTDHEPQARANYSLEMGFPISEVGLVMHPTITEAAASPDGLVGDSGLVEIKCPNTATHIETLRSQTIDGKYIKQMQWQMACTGCMWCDFVSFDPRMPAEMEMFVQRIIRDGKMIAEIEDAVTVFLTELTETVDELRSLYPPIEEAA
jgi:putative phage-type endonuclease